MTKYSIQKRQKPTSCKNGRKSGSRIQIQLEMMDGDCQSELSSVENAVVHQMGKLRGSAEKKNFAQLHCLSAMEHIDTEPARPKLLGF